MSALPPPAPEFFPISTTDQPSPLVTMGGILIGGESRRMGQPKHLLEWRSGVLLDHLVAVLRPLVAQVVVVGAGELPPSCAELSRLADAPMPDGTPGRGGPLGGVLAMLRFAPDARWMVISCDMPLLCTDALDWLASFWTPETAGVVGIFEDEQGGIVQPFPGIFHGRLLPTAERLWREQRRAPKWLADDPDVRRVVVAEKWRAAWRNINTPAEWAALGPLGR